MPQTSKPTKMDIKKFSIGAIVGGITLFLLGFVFYAVLFSSFYEANVGSATGVMRADDQMNMPLLIVGNIAMAALLTYIFLKWAGISTFVTGLKAGLVIGALMALSYNLIQFSTTNIMNLQAALVDVLVYAVMVGLGGGIIGLVLGKIK